MTNFLGFFAEHFIIPETMDKNLYFVNTVNSKYELYLCYSKLYYIMDIYIYVCVNKIVTLIKIVI